MVSPANVARVGPETGFAEQGFEPEPEVNLWKYIEPIRRRRNVVIACLAVTLAIAIILYIITPPAYRASTVLQVERKVPGASEGFYGWDPDWQSYYPTQKRLLMSRGLAERVVKNLNLASDPAFNRVPARRPSRASGTEGPTTTEEDAAALGSLGQRLLGSLKVDLVPDTQLIEISYDCSSPKLAARIANGVADTFIDWGIETRRQTVGQAAAYVGSQIDALKKEIQDKEAQLQAYSQRADIVNLDPSANDTMQRLEELNRQYTTALSDRITREARYKELTGASEEAVSQSIPGGLLSELRLEQYRLEREYATKLAIYKPDWPAMQQLAVQIEKGRADLAKATAEVVGKARDAARADVQEAQRRETSLRDEMAKQKADAMNLNSASVEYNNLKVEVSTRRSLLNDLLKRQSQMGVEGEMKEQRISNVIVVDRALEPGGPYRPSLKRNLQFGLLVGLAIGIGLVFLIEHFDRSLKTPEDVDRWLGVPLLAVIPAVGSSAGRDGRLGTPLRPRGQTAESHGDTAIELLPHLQPRLAACEAYRSLRTALMLSTASGLKSLAVTSAVSSEGKTSTAVNLAIVLAQLDRKVLVIDADMRRPHLHDVLGCSNRSGLVNHLAGGEESSAIVFKTQVPNLSLIPAGPVPPNPSELLSSDRMGRLLESVRADFDHIVIDTPPVLPVTDPIVVGKQVDGLVFCVGAGKVAREHSTMALQRLLHGEVKVLGAVLNLYVHRAARYAYHYYHYFQSDERAADAKTA